MKRIIATTVLSLLLTTSAFTASHTSALMPYAQEQTGDVYASNFIGMRVYASETEFDAMNAETRVQAGAEKEWDDIGEINDVILGRDGSVKAVIIGVGGFIGIGEKDVAVAMDGIKFVAQDGDADDFFLVVNSNKQALTDIEAYSRLSATEEMDAKTDTAMTDPAATDTAMTDPAATDTAMTDPAATETEATSTMMSAPTVERDGYMVAKTEDLTTERLTGARVYGVKDQDIGEVDQLIVTDSGELKEAVLDIGGFLGLGEHRIAVDMSEIQILRNDGDDVRIYIDATKEQLEARPKYEG